MSKLPDLEALAVFARVADLGSFSAAADAMGVSKPTVSKAVSRLEARLGSRLLQRTSRRLGLTEAGSRLRVRAEAMLREAEAAEAEGLANAAEPQGLVRLAAPMSFGLKEVAPRLPEFLKRHPGVKVDLHLSDAHVDLIGGGFDAAVRIGTLPDSSLVARKVGDIPMRLVAAPELVRRRGSLGNPAELAAAPCLGYAYQRSPVWRFSGPDGEEASVRPDGPLRATSGDALTPALLAGLGYAALPEFIVEPHLASGGLVLALEGWTLPAAPLHLVTPPGGPRPARVSALLDFFGRTLVACARPSHA